MTDVLTFALLGIGVGAGYAIAAMGLVVVYRGSGVVNFAHVGIAVVAAYVYAKLLDAGVPEVGAVVAGLGCAGTGAAAGRTRDPGPRGARCQPEDARRAGARRHG